RGVTYDSISVTGNAIFESIEITLADDYRPSADDEYVLIDGTLFPGVVGSLMDELGGGLGHTGDASTEGQYVLRITGVEGDYNYDGVVDTADYTLWRDREGQEYTVQSLAADGNGDGQVDQQDYDIWKANFGRVATFAASAPTQLPAAFALAVPEPCSAACVVTVSLLLRLSGRWRRK
ncbi:MAG: dockerin type I domain-containing protein, partial [Planctomycetota bacterium]